MACGTAQTLRSTATRDPSAARTISRAMRGATYTYGVPALSTKEQQDDRDVDSLTRRDSIARRFVACAPTRFNFPENLDC
jgi:hypothetical protein